MAKGPVKCVIVGDIEYIQWDDKHSWVYKRSGLRVDDNIVPFLEHIWNDISKAWGIT